MKIVRNRFRGSGLAAGSVQTIGNVRHDATAALSLLSHCPAASETPLVDVAHDLGIAKLLIKDERTRMRLGSFKALGAAHAIAKAAFLRLGKDLLNPEMAKGALKGRVFTAATAGNHGLSVAAGARIFGARAVIFIANTVPDEFAARLQSAGAEVKRQGATYEDSLTAAMQAAKKNGWALLSDTSWPGYEAAPLDVMEGYLVMADEIAGQIAARPQRPSHVFLQAGVGGLAAAVAAHLRARWGDGFQIVVVEPEAAPALQSAIEAGHPVVVSGPVSTMGRLDCKEASHLALAALARDADYFVTISDASVTAALPELAALGLATSASGGAGYGALKALATQGAVGLSRQSRALVILSEGEASD